MNYENVKKIIDEWDPIGLLALGCPPNEYDLEIKLIVNQLKGNPTIGDKRGRFMRPAPLAPLAHTPSRGCPYTRATLLRAV